MMRQIGNLLFSSLGRDQRRWRMRVVIVTLLVIIFVGGMMVAAIFYLNKH